MKCWLGVFSLILFFQINLEARDELDRDGIYPIAPEEASEFSERASNIFLSDQKSRRPTSSSIRKRTSQSSKVKRNSRKTKARDLKKVRQRKSNKKKSSKKTSRKRRANKK